MFSNFFDNRADYEITWKNIVEPGRPRMTVWRMRFTYRIIKTTKTRSEYPTYCSSTTTMLERTGLTVAFRHTLPVLFVLSSVVFVVLSPVLMPPGSSFYRQAA